MCKVGSLRVWARPSLHRRYRPSRAMYWYTVLKTNKQPLTAKQTLISCMLKLSYRNKDLKSAPHHHLLLLVFLPRSLVCSTYSTIFCSRSVLFPCNSLIVVTYILLGNQELKTTRETWSSWTLHGLYGKTVSQSKIKQKTMLIYSFVRVILIKEEKF